MAGGRGSKKIGNYFPLTHPRSPFFGNLAPQYFKPPASVFFHSQARISFNLAKLLDNSFKYSHYPILLGCKDSLA
jgi:hypothetical protein